MFQLRSACPEEACPAAVTPSRAATANSDTKRTQGIGRQPALSTPLPHLASRRPR
jgi:hypothetical protein